MTFCGLCRGVARSAVARTSVTTVGALVASVSLFSSPSFAAEITDVVDAFDTKLDASGQKVEDPFDIHIEPQFKRTLKRAKITREAPCNPSATDNASAAGQPNSRLTYPRLVDASRCSEPSTVFNKEMRAYEVTNELDVLVQIGLFRDVELHLELPFILGQVQGVKYAGDGGDPTADSVDDSNSSVDPSDERIISDIQRNGDQFSTFRLFNLDSDPTESESRAGFGDMVVGMAWSPFNDERDDTKANLKLAFDYKIPSGGVAKPGNGKVGRGMHELTWSIASSKRFKYMEPYFQVAYTLPIAANNSMFKDIGVGQTLVEPGQRAEIIFGSEFVPYEDIARGNRFNIDVGLKFGYTAEGRDYSLLSDALSGSECNGLTPSQVADAIAAVQAGSLSPDVVNTASCRWILDEPGNGDGQQVYDLSDDAAGNVGFYHNGLTDYEAFATFGAYLGFYLQAANYVQFRGKVGLDHEQAHFITAARTGKDSNDENDTVKFDDPGERNPYFNPVLDAVGNRFRVEETTIFTWSITMALQF